ncbi:MAG TPA: CobW family GTP-binding protein, partial [Candidatus Entotheonella sp.]
MRVRTPLILITGPLGSGKTTLLRHLVETIPSKLAIVMNEFGDIAIDSRIVEGKHVRIAELGGGCVCCALLGEFETALEEIIDTVGPDLILAETTGVAEPDAIVFDIQDSLPRVRLDSVMTVVDADGMVRYPHIGHTGRRQIEAADLILLNKADLVSAAELEQIEAQLSHLNDQASIIRTQHCRVDPQLVCGVTRERELTPPLHVHQPEFAACHYTTDATFNRSCFERFVASLSPHIIRAKGFVRFPEGAYLFNFVAGRWELEPFAAEQTMLVFIGAREALDRSAIVHALQQCAC